MDLLAFLSKTAEANIAKAIREFSFQPPKVEIVEEKEDLVKAYVYASEGGDFPVTISDGVGSCGCRENFQKGEICKHILVLVFYLIRERNS
jgi:hypothetical protein